MAHPRTHGFGILELLVVISMMSVMMVGVTSAFLAQSRAHGQQDVMTAMEENLRAARGMIGDGLRGAGYGVPGSGSFDDWIPWAPWFDGNPWVVQGAGGAPDWFAVAGCFRPVVARLAASYTPAIDGDLLTVAAEPGRILSDELDANTRRLIMINGTEYAHVVAVGSSTITIDANPVTSGNQPLDDPPLPLPAGAPICRVDVLRYSIDSSGSVPRLVLDENHGLGPQPIAEGITDMQITSQPFGRHQIRLALRSERRDPITGTFLARTVDLDFAKRN